MDNPTNNQNQNQSPEQAGLNNASSAAPVKQTRWPLIVCCISAVLLIAGVAIVAMMGTGESKNNKKGGDPSSQVADGGDDEDEEDPEELNEFVDKVEYNESMTFEDVEVALASIGYVAPEEDEEGGEDIADDYKSERNAKPISFEWEDSFFSKYTGYSSTAILDTIYDYFESVYPEYKTITLVDGSWSGYMFQIKADDGTIFKVGVDANVSPSGSLLEVKKISIFTESDQQLLANDIEIDRDSATESILTSDLDDIEATALIQNITPEEDDDEEE